MNRLKHSDYKPEYSSYWLPDAVDVLRKFCGGETSEEAAAHLRKYSDGELGPLLVEMIALAMAETYKKISDA